ncbi:LytTr DNA-binding domain protein [compost metagenome]
MILENVEDRLIIKKRNHILLLDIDEIMFIERCRSHSIINTLYEEILINNTLKEIIGLLPKEFVRGHRSFIVNKKLIKELVLLNENVYEAVYTDNKYALIHKKSLEFILE